MEILKERLSTTTIGLIVIALFILITSLWISGGSETAGSLGFYTPTAKVKRGSFSIYVVESATLDAKTSVTLSSELPSNQAKVLYLVPEGDLIQHGEIVAKFDPAPFEEAIQKLENEIKEEQAKLVQAQAEASLQAGENQGRLDNLAYQIKLAEIQLNNLKKSNMPLREAQAKQELSKAQAEYQTAKGEQATQEELFEQGFTKAKSLKEARDNAQDKLALYRIKQRNYRSLKEVTLPAELKRAQLKLENSRVELESYRLANVQRTQKQKAIIQRSENKIDSLKQNLERAHGNLSKTVVKAPVSGIVLYKTMSISNEKRKPQVGDSLWNRQSFAVIPDLSSLVAYTNIRESEVGKLAEGQQTTVQPEAYPRLSLSGTVASIGTLASGEDDAASGANHFRVRIALDEIDPKLRPGMTAKVSILARSYEDVLQLPVEAVFYRGQESVCFLWRDGSPRAVTLDLGENDGNYVVVNAGLEEGQEVMLTYPES